MADPRLKEVQDVRAAIAKTIIGIAGDGASPHLRKAVSGLVQLSQSYNRMHEVEGRMRGEDTPTPEESADDS